VAPSLFRAARFDGRAAACIVALALVAGSSFAAYGLNAELHLRPGPDEFNIAAWEVRHFPGKWLYLAGTLLEGTPSAERQEAGLRRFFALTRDIEAMERRLSDARRQPGEASDPALLESLQAALRERDELENQVEATVESRLAWAIESAGITRSFLDVVWPPVDFEFTDSPRTLVVSPRERLEVQSTDLLAPGLTLGDVERIEAEVEAGGGVSALAVETGGVSAYPNIIDYTAGYADAVETVAHEWMHNYLFFRPLGFNYYDSNDLRAINETVADLAGRELARIVLSRWPAADGEAPAPSTAAPGPPSFDAGAELRALRGEVEALLAAGRVEEAEALMEARRRELAARGFYIRRLNQAYFAFTNLYAGPGGSPAATNPIGPKIAELRARSGTLKRFVERLSGVTSAAELDRLLASPE